MGEYRLPPAYSRVGRLERGLAAVVERVERLETDGDVGALALGNVARLEARMQALDEAGGWLAKRVMELEAEGLKQEYAEAFGTSLGEAVESAPGVVERVRAWTGDPGDECGCGFCAADERRAA